MEVKVSALKCVFCKKDIVLGQQAVFIRVKGDTKSLVSPDYDVGIIHAANKDNCLRKLRTELLEYDNE